MNHWDPTRAEDQQARFVAPLLVVLLSVAVYLPALSGDFIWDDDFWITNNSAVQSVSGLWKIWTDPRVNQQYYPITATSFWSEFRLFGNHPLGYHLTNILLHAANAVLIGFILRSLSVRGAWIAAALFAVHPVHVESVAWITERKNVLSGLFYLLALQRYLRYAAGARAGQYFLAFALFVAALLSKTATCTLPVAIAIILAWRRERFAVRDVVRLIPFVAIAVVAAALTAYLEVHHAGAQGTPWQHSALQKVILAGRVFWFYPAKLLWPATLMFIYPRWTLDPTSAVQFLYPAAAVASGLVLWVGRHRIGTGAISAVALYVVTISPALGFVPVFFMRYAFVQDHFQYLATIPLIATAAFLLSTLQRRLMRSCGAMPSHLPIAIALVVLSVLAARRTLVFRSSEQLWTDSLAKNPNAWLPHNNLGIILTGKGRSQEAIEHYERAIALRPGYFETYLNLGLALMERGDCDAAILNFRKGLAINDRFPGIHSNIAACLRKQGHAEQAISEFHAALDLDPFYEPAHTALGEMLLKSEDHSAALQFYRDAVEHDSPFAADYNNYANLLLEYKTPAGVEQLYRRALEIGPDYADAHYNLGVLLSDSDRIAEATEHLATAVRLEPGNAKAAFNLAVLLQRVGNMSDALEALRRAVAADPSYAAAHYNLATLLLQQGDVSSAIDHFQRTIAIAPDMVDAHHNFAIALYRAGRYEAAWREVKTVQRHGQPVSPDFIKALSARMPEPDGRSDTD